MDTLYGIFLFRRSLIENTGNRLRNRKRLIIFMCDMIRMRRLFFSPRLMKAMVKVVFNKLLVAKHQERLGQCLLLTCTRDR